MARLEEIGFYTLSDSRAFSASTETPLQRCELILTDTCNFKCRYCRGLRKDCRGTMPFELAEQTVGHWLDEGLKNVRFSGGEPSLYKRLTDLVRMCRDGGVERIAVSTNGSADMDLYLELLDAGVNDFSISLDGGCCSIGDNMAGVSNSWGVVVDRIRELSKRTYVTVGMVFTEANIDQCVEAVLFADSLGVSDVRVIPAAQYDKALLALQDLPEEVLAKYPILRYRIAHLRGDRHVRGMSENDCRHCWLMLDDMAIAGQWHFPCIIYLREGGDPVGRIGPDMRAERLNWILNHDCYEDPICRQMCLDVCVDYNNKAAMSPVRAKDENDEYCSGRCSEAVGNVAS